MANPDRILDAVNSSAEVRALFWSRVDCDKSANECWEWQGPRDHKEYGRAWMKGIGYLAHRFAYISVRGAIEPHLTIDHLCRNPPCCNPTHMEPVTVWENTLRGNGQSAINYRKTHCKRGHPLSGDNLDGLNGHRRCRACKKMHNAARDRSRR